MNELKSSNFGGYPQKYIRSNQPQSEKVTCPICGRPIESVVTKKPKWPAFVLVIVFYCLLPCIFLDCMGFVWRFEHKCPRCNSDITKAPGFNRVGVTEFGINDDKGPTVY